MEFMFRPINEEDAGIIISYKHGNEYSCFDRDKHESDIDTLLASDEVDFFVATDEEEDMIGFVEVTFDDDGTMEMSGALLPDYSGEGMGLDFITQCIEYLVEHYDYEGTNIVSLVKPGQKAAMKVLKRLGFQVVEETEEWIEMSIEL